MSRRPRLVPALPGRAASSEPEVRRLPPLELAVVQAQPPEQPQRSFRRGSSTAAVHRDSRTVRRGRAVARDCGNGSQSGTSVVPEPQPPAERIRRRPTCSLPRRNPTRSRRRRQCRSRWTVARPATAAARLLRPNRRWPQRADEGHRAGLGRADAFAGSIGGVEEARDHAGWATEASAAVHKLGPAISVGAAETTEILQHLEQLTSETPSLLTKVNDEALPRICRGHPTPWNGGSRSGSKLARWAAWSPPTPPRRPSIREASTSASTRSISSRAIRRKDTPGGSTC